MLLIDQNGNFQLASVDGANGFKLVGIDGGGRAALSVGAPGTIPAGGSAAPGANRGTMRSK